MIQGVELKPLATRADERGFFREGSPTFGETMEPCLGENATPAVLKIPPGVAHGCKAIGGATHLFYVTSGTYDPSEEGRLPHDDAAIGYDWLAGPPIK
ncbi:MAG: dTDP-4-dehydrorhamnose 3,5-epimerase family protein [Chloroflexota bacterium]